jgi:hypothetical protein
LRLDRQRPPRKGSGKNAPAATPKAAPQHVALGDHQQKSRISSFKAKPASRAGFVG